MKLLSKVRIISDMNGRQMAEVTFQSTSTFILDSSQLDLLRVPNSERQLKEIIKIAADIVSNESIRLDERHRRYFDTGWMSPINSKKADEPEIDYLILHELEQRFSGLFDLRIEGAYPNVDLISNYGGSQHRGRISGAGFAALTADYNLYLNELRIDETNINEALAADPADIVAAGRLRIVREIIEAVIDTLARLDFLRDRWNEMKDAYDQAQADREREVRERNHREALERTGGGDPESNINDPVSRLSP